MMRVGPVPLILMVSVWLIPAPARAEGDVAFFESKIRPTLADHCYKCHSAKSEKLKGGLRLDSREGLSRGGETGAVVVPGHPETSRLIDAIGYQNVDLQMPPKAKLSAQQIEDLTLWVKKGAPWPAEAGKPTVAAGDAGHSFDIQRRKASHWAWQPVRVVPAPTVKHADRV